MTSNPTRDAGACCSACSPPATAFIEPISTIACSLDAVALSERERTFRELARRSLLTSRREPTQLRLTYSEEALAEVENLVAREAECCSFLSFEVRRTAGSVELTIVAPAEAAFAADELLVPFAPANDGGATR